MRFHEYRTLIQALLFSLSVHAVLLLGVVSTYRPQAGVPAVAMNIVIAPKRLPEPVKPVTPMVEMSRKSRAVQPTPSSRAEAQKAAPAPQKRAASQAAPSRARFAVREASPLLAPVTPVAAGVSDAMPATPSAAAAPAPASAPAVDEAPGVRAGVSADDVRRYRVSLASAARRFKRYPALARERGWEGTVEVAIRFASALPAPDVVVVRSSGHDLLDEQAVQMMAQAARTTTLPDGLRGRDLEIPLPVKFSLDEAQ